MAFLLLGKAKETKFSIKFHAFGYIVATGVQPILLSGISYVFKGVIFWKHHFYALKRKYSPNK
jgi:hypothetical protein